MGGALIPFGISPVAFERRGRAERPVSRVLKKFPYGSAEIWGMRAAMGCRLSFNRCQPIAAASFQFASASASQCFGWFAARLSGTTAGGARPGGPCHAEAEPYAPASQPDARSSVPPGAVSLRVSPADDAPQAAPVQRDVLEPASRQDAPVEHAFPVRALDAPRAVLPVAQLALRLPDARELLRA